MKKYLFAYSISPVQTFIAQARKIQDLYAGSSILSHLVDDTMKQFSKSDEIIFPMANYPSKPNRITAIIDKDNPYEFGANLEAYTKKRLKEYIDKIYNEYTDGKKPSNFDEQLNNFLQIRWCCVPYDETNYRDGYKKLESLFNSVKNVREFNQIEETGRKCSLCGERNALIYNVKDNVPRYAQKDFVNLHDGRIIENEGLCSICFGKRFYNKGFSDSTASIAAMDIKYFLKNSSEGLPMLINYKGMFSSTGFDDEMFFEENINEEHFRKADYKYLISNIETIKDSYDKLKKFCKANNKKIKSYYALAAFDGDSMGKWFNGEKIKDDVDLKEFVSELSKRLGEYAAWITKDIKEPYGKVIYAGGEDYLVFINLDGLFETIEKLRYEFDEKVNKPLKKYFKNQNDDITFSAGIVISHYKHPLSNTLNYAREMAEYSKDLHGKDAFTVAVIKHSGEICRTRYKWFKDEMFTPEMIAQITKLIGSGVFSDTFIKNIENEFKPFENDNVETVDDKIINCELKRLVKRSYAVRDSKTKESDISSMQNIVRNIYSNSYKDDKLNNFFSLLDIANFCGRVI